MAETENSNEEIGIPAFASYSITFIINVTTTTVQIAGHGGADTSNRRVDCPFPRCLGSEDDMLSPTLIYECVWS